MFGQVLDGKNILITGGTGSFGYACVRELLGKYNPNKVIILSRDEMKQWKMASDFEHYGEKLRFFLGDVRDVERLKMSFRDVDIVIHAAATKIVHLAEYNPFECVKTNIWGAMNVVEAALFAGVKNVVALSTDKASSPVNLYGATKLTSDKIFIAASHSYSGSTNTKFSVVRYGNVMGSRGSVIPFFINYPKDKPLPITDVGMTRFMITLEEGVDLVFTAILDMLGGELYVKKIPTMNILDIAKSVREDFAYEEVGIRPGEKLHEQMIGLEDCNYTYEYDSYYKILPAIYDVYKRPEYIKDGIKVSDKFEYTSNNKNNIMLVEELRKWIEDNKHKMLDL